MLGPKVVNFMVRKWYLHILSPLEWKEAEAGMTFFAFQKPLNVTVIRRGEKHQLRLIPTRWAGKGLLG
jgi:hypothetical protein